MLHLCLVHISDHYLPDCSGAMKVKIVTAPEGQWYENLRGRVRVVNHIVKIWDEYYYVMRNYKRRMRVIPCEHAKIIEL